MSKSDQIAFDLLSTVEYGGCSAKLSPKQLEEVLLKLPVIKNDRLLVDIETHDDAGVYLLNDDTALIFTTDFFPPVCSDPYQFGKIAASNAISDVYAMGGTPLLALNLMMFSSEKIPMEAFSQIMQGGLDKVNESGAILVGGHTIDDHPPKYGLAVIGTVHPDKLITNAGAEEGDVLVLTKPIGTGALVAAQRLDLAEKEHYERALEQMELLNKAGAEVAANYDVKAATDITGFGLLGHALKMAKASNLSMHINTRNIPLLDGAYSIYDDGCIPGAAFRNLEFVSEDVSFAKDMDYNLKMLCCDTQTSGGLLICVKEANAKQLIQDIKATGLHPSCTVIGKVIPKGRKDVYLD